MAIKVIAQRRELKIDHLSGRGWLKHNNPRQIISLTGMFLFLLEELGQIGVESGIFTYDNLGDFALRVNDNLGGEALDAILRGDGLQLLVGAAHLQPGQLVLIHSGTPLLFCVATVNTQYLHLVLILGIGLLHVGDATDTPDAP